MVGRLADAFAVLSLTGVLAGQALGMHAAFRNPIKQLWQRLTAETAETAEADRASLAAMHAFEWATAHEKEFRGRRGSDDGHAQPTAGWAGRWDIAAPGGQWEWVGYLPHKLREVLQAAQFDFEATVRTWQERGWLLVDPKDRQKRYHQTRMGDGSVRQRVIAIRRAAFDSNPLAIPDQTDRNGADRWITDFMRRAGLNDLYRWMPPRGPLSAEQTNALAADIQAAIERHTRGGVGPAAPSSAVGSVTGVTPA